MPGSFEFEPFPAPLAGNATPISVCLYDPNRGDDGRYALLPNVHCERIRYQDGPEPAMARFRYVLNDSASARGVPGQCESLWPIDATGPYVAGCDERIVVLATAPSGRECILFDGFAQVPRVDITPVRQEVTFLAVGVAARCWDNPIGGRLERNADDPQAGAVVRLDLPTRFNPDGMPNCTPEGADIGRDQPRTAYPVFLDPSLERRPDPRAYWTLGKFTRYILATCNDERFVENPDFAGLDELLQVRAPVADTGFVDPTTAGEYVIADAVIRDFDATNMPWPEALATQLDYAGFGMRFVTGDDGSGGPASRLEIYRKDAAGRVAPRHLDLPESGAELDPGRCDVAILHIERDARSIVNAITVETRPRRVELSVVLAPGFVPLAGDETAVNRVRFLRTHLEGVDGSGSLPRMYRVYVADEAGDGHWDASEGAWSTSAVEMSPVFPDDDRGRPTRVRRLRPGSGTLLTRDDSGRPLRAQLAISRDYAGACPAVWDGTGTWQPIAGGWELLPDRLGIRVTVEDPDVWPIGGYAGPSPQEPSGTLRGISSQCNPGGPNTRFVLRLTTVVDDDLMLAAATSARPASPTAFARRRRVDARDHFSLETVSPSSPYHGGIRPLVLRDDTERAIAHARQLRSAYEFPPLAGRVTIPSLITAFHVGDRISRINGRDIAFNTNVGLGQGESPVYPIVVSLTWEFEGDRQATVIELADRQADRPAP